MDGGSFYPDVFQCHFNVYTASSQCHRSSLDVETTLRVHRESDESEVIAECNMHDSPFSLNLDCSFTKFSEPTGWFEIQLSSSLVRNDVIKRVVTRLDR